MSRKPSPLGRRRFLQSAGAVGVGLPLGGLLAMACSDGDSPPAAAGGATAAATNTPLAQQPSDHDAEHIDEAHREGVEKFLANIQSPITTGRGNQPLVPRMEGDVKVYDLTIDDIRWELAPGMIEEARGYNKAVPGPILRATEGDKVRINVKNNLSESSVIHWHGLRVPNTMDGVPYVTQDPIKAGGTFTYEFTLRNWGTHMYHSHHNALDQVNRGLLGAFIVDPKDPADYPRFDREYVIIINDTMLGYTLNGKQFPATDPVVAKKGERILIRWLNEGLMIHPMHLHGMPMEVFAIDGYMLQQPYKCDTLNVPPGNRFDTIVVADEPGVWAFHCHILSHVESSEGMFGMVTALIVEE